eukprot:841935-Amphidinium_carterae.1
MNSIATTTPMTTETSWTALAHTKSIHLPEFTVSVGAAQFNHRSRFLTSFTNIVCSKLQLVAGQRRDDCYKREALAKDWRAHAEMVTRPWIKTADNILSEPALRNILVGCENATGKQCPLTA